MVLCRLNVMEPYLVENLQNGLDKIYASSEPFFFFEPRRPLTIELWVFDSVTLWARLMMPIKPAKSAHVYNQGNSTIFIKWFSVMNRLRKLKIIPYHISTCSDGTYRPWELCWNHRLSILRYHLLVFLNHLSCRIVWSQQNLRWAR